MRIYILDWVNLLKGGRHFKGTIFQEHKISKFCCDISFFFHLSCNSNLDKISPTAAAAVIMKSQTTSFQTNKKLINNDFKRIPLYKKASQNHNVDIKESNIAA